jgi:predicted O-methyltransferase YrrM
MPLEQESTPVTLDDLLRDAPNFHRHMITTGCWGLGEDMLRFLDRHLRPGMRTIETGAGVSTVLFALKGARHTCVVPDAQQVDAIRSYCTQRAISLEQVEFVVAPSQDVLPGLGGTFDLALIDGAHGFPLPFLDWFYLARLLKRGGLVVIDDLYIWTCAALAEFLESEPNWKLVTETWRAAVFEKRSDQVYVEWNFQGYVRRRSRATGPLAKAGYAVTLLARGKLSLLWLNIIGRIPRGSGKR